MGEIQRKRRFEHLAAEEAAVWTSAERVRARYAGFPQSRDVDAATWDSKLAFWKRTLLTCVKHRHLENVHVTHLTTPLNLEELLAFADAQPLGLDIVLVSSTPYGVAQYSVCT